MPIKVRYLSPDGSLQHDLSEDKVVTAYESKQGLLRVDNVMPTIDSMSDVPTGERGGRNTAGVGEAVR